MGIFARVAALFTRAPKLAPVTGAVMPQLPLWAQYTRIGGGLTPAQVSAILYQADTGYVWRLVDLANEARQKDGHLQSVLATREGALSSLPFSVSAHSERGRKAPKRRDLKVAEFVEDAIRGAVGNGDDVRSFVELIEHLQGAIFHGFAVAEIVWKKVDGYLVPDGFRLHNQRRFIFRQSDGRLVWSDQWGAAGIQGVDVRAEFPGQFIVEQVRVNGDVQAREGLSRLLVWAALFRNWTTADWLKLAELSWKPWRFGKLGKDAGEADRDALVDILDRLTTDGIAVLTAEQDVDLKWAAGGSESSSRSSGHQALCEFMAGEMSKAVLGQTLTTETGKLGSRALGDVHNDVRLEYRSRDASGRAATIRRDLVKWIVELNFGPGTPISECSIDTEDATDLGAFGTAVQGLQKTGMRIPAAWAYDVSGVPQPDDDDEILGEDEIEVVMPDEPPAEDGAAMPDAEHGADPAVEQPAAQ